MEVRKLKGIVLNRDGSKMMKWEESSTEIPAALVVRDLPSGRDSFHSQKKPPITEWFAVGSTVIFHVVNGVG